MSEHTPGPWKIHRGFSDWGMPSQHDIYVGDEELIAGVPSRTPYCMGASAKDKNYAATQWANAQLIAAAPELLEALKAALPVVEAAHKEAILTPNTPGEWWAWYEELQIVRAAIAKTESV